MSGMGFHRYRSRYATEMKDSQRKENAMREKFDSFARFWVGYFAILCFLIGCFLGMWSRHYDSGAFWVLVGIFLMIGEQGMGGKRDA
jgi:hypothetical protein